MDFLPFTNYKLPIKKKNPHQKSPVSSAI